jgi:hypothetical protein
MHLAGIEPAIPTSERPQNYASDRAATCNSNYCVQFKEQKTINSARTHVDTNTELIDLPEATTASPGLVSAVSM